MFVKIGNNDYECYVNIRCIESFGRIRLGNNPMVQAVGPRQMMLVPTPPATFEYFISMRGQIPDHRITLTEEDYNKVVSALQGAGSEHLYGD